MVKKAVEGKEVKLSKREQGLVVESYNRGLNEGYVEGLIKGYQRASQLITLALSNDLNALIKPKEAKEVT